MRYNRQIILPEIGEKGQQKLREASVLVIGAGGLGCPVLQNLAAAGVGHIGIVDGDVIDESNLHRQLLYKLEHCGKNKAETAAQVIAEMNPDVQVTVYPRFFNSSNAFEVVSEYQLIVDCTDTLAIRYLINDVAVYKKIPVVYASIYRFEGQVSVFNYQNGPSYRCLFPEKEGLQQALNCEVMGVLGVLPNALGTFQATEVLKIILGIGEVLSGKLLVYDALQFQTQLIAFAKNPKAIEKSRINGSLLFHQKQTVENLTPESFFEKIEQENVVVVDVRELNEFAEFSIKNSIQIPLEQLERGGQTLDKKKEIILFCNTGQRSSQALNYLKKQGFELIFHLEKGIRFLKKNKI
ncbi:HesA/MoeB/ThiF family protein [Flavobacterium sp. UMI-01]|uniref:HesA/MoeB/ThiF family protein n=1 Tax=Flavobacterium sp. UMI-01 TaxID=1441053 RepID=UPI001C7DF971|nr:HesA/MoeB/ThiF family protein [Flavobacterium sp. UMI-01]GIZ07548.1 thiazole biosynthesis adenylyltransferase ThiF [Flavobacterium sp. UMI-01]